MTQPADYSLVEAVRMIITHLSAVLARRTIDRKSLAVRVVDSVRFRQLFRGTEREKKSSC